MPYRDTPKIRATYKALCKAEHDYAAAKVAHFAAIEEAEDAYIAKVGGIDLLTKEQPNEQL